MSSELQDVETFELAYCAKPMRVDREKSRKVPTCATGLPHGEF
jgi:hypothetical protein